ncbi:alpha-amylase family glycosyl hydrolase [Parageobacillus sp. KH3-4]|jgi:glucosylglycerate phosphorylase|uniref:alpha-amylase family glycosyl hydrolase n=1 Tax=Parageobacillus sp. KH3-4 TaxID=2916802 RepID=UPI001FCADA40|nr:alpha-amylase family glycosyl hydrolase [Parageobacillus sp. KH3-4]BDG49053.1 sucrose phosphorylase [Parageobacillus sp. KH3-4]
MKKCDVMTQVEQKLKEIYGQEYKEEYATAFRSFIERWEAKQWRKNESLSEKNVYLITYGDSIFEKGKPTLDTLHRFLKEQVGDIITDVHLLPMFPYTSDDGFAVTDYRKIHPKLGDWEQIEAMAADYRLMFDFVANHISKSSEWFQRYLADDPKYEHYFIPKDPSFDTSNVIRPRTTPLFHEYQGIHRVKTAWTTFSEDQVDLNFRHFPVLLEMTDILLEYAHKHGASIRLDAIGFIWKESGTSCMHLPQTHAIIQLWRLLLDYFQPNTNIITETNVPHDENIRYFGNGTNEAHMVYQFSLPPLVLYTFTVHHSRKLTEWAKTIDKVSDSATYFNFLASHDGIGMRPTEGILTEEEKQLLVDKVLQNGGKVSYKTDTDGSQSVYELNINYFDALINKGVDVTEQQQVQKMLAAHAILLSVIGVPAIYYHSLLGSRNDYKGLEQSGIPRRINREKLEYNQIVRELQTNSRRRAIFHGLKRMIAIRRTQSAFSPYAPQQVIELGDHVFAVKRTNEQTGDSIYFVVNVTPTEVAVDLGASGEDLWTGEKINKLLRLLPYQFVWVKEKLS